MTFANDQKRIAHFLDTLATVPHYDVPSRGTVVLKVDGVVVHEGRESLVSWTNRHYAKVDSSHERIPLPEYVERQFRFVRDGIRKFPAR